MVRAAANRAVSTPLGMSTGSPPSCSTCQRRAISDTAMPPRIFSSAGRSSGRTSCSMNEPELEAWYVATSGPRAIHSATME